MWWPRRYGSVSDAVTGVNGTRPVFDHEKALRPQGFQRYRYGDSNPGFRRERAKPYLGPLSTVRYR
jgi:hypothetical protein